MLNFLNKDKANGLHKFPGGLHLDYHKAECSTRPIKVAPPPQRVILPLAQHIGEPAVPVVDFGDTVKRGQLIAKPSGYISAAIHAPISGDVVAIGDFSIPHPSGLKGPAIMIESDGKDEHAPIGQIIAGDAEDIDAAELRQIIRDAGIVGLGGAAFPSAAKLNPGPNTAIDTLILNGAECEPYIACDQKLMAERPGQIIAGIGLMLHATEAKKCLIAVEDNKPEAITALREVLAHSGRNDTEVVVVPTRYPEGGEKQLIQVITGREVPANGLPAQIGVIVHNVATAVAVHKAVHLGEPLISRLVTVTGGGIAEPQIIEARIGTPISELVDLAGGYTEGVNRLIMGGPMMGFALESDDLPIIKSTNCILAALPGEIDTGEKQAMPCIRCGACAEVCPVSLLPQQLYWHARARDLDAVQEYKLFDCIECGCCAQVCPSQIPLVQYYRYAKGEIWETERDRRKSDIARVRFESREDRLAREAAEKKAKAEAKKKALQAGDASKQAAISAALERAKAKKDSIADTQPDAKQDPDAKPAASGAAAALAKARAASAAKQADAGKTAATDSGKQAEAPAKSAAQIAIEKAKAARTKTEATPPAGSEAAATTSPAKSAAQVAIEKAKAAGANKEPGDESNDTDPTAAPAEKSPVQLALEKARAAAAAKRDTE